MLGTLAIAIAVGHPLYKEGTLPDAAPRASADSESDDGDALLQALGLENDEQLREAIYDGFSLADIARAGGKDPAAVVELQVAEALALLEQRYASGSITEETYLAQREEIPEVVERSVYDT